MRISIEEKNEYSKSPHIIIQCQKQTLEVQEIVTMLEQKQKKLVGTREGNECVIQPQEVLYCESVDGFVYIYTKEEVYRTNRTLMELEKEYEGVGYFRCSKSMVLNINEIKELKSEFGNRIDARLTNGEHIMISRRYAKELRATLKGGRRE